MYYFLTTEVPAWIEIENNTLELPLHLYLYSAPTKILTKQAHNPFQSHHCSNEAPKLSGFTPVWGNENFRAVRCDMGLKHWIEKGRSTIKDLHNEGTLMSFQQLIDKHDLPRKHYFNYLQIISFIYSQIKTTLEPALSPVETFTVNHLYDRGQFSEILLAKRTQLRVSLHGRVQTQTINTRFKLLQYKWLLRTYITLVKLHHLTLRYL